MQSSEGESERERHSVVMHRHSKYICPPRMDLLVRSNKKRARDTVASQILWNASLIKKCVCSSLNPVNESETLTYILFLKVIVCSLMV